MELDEEKEIIQLAAKAGEELRDHSFRDMEEIAGGLVPEFRDKIREFLGIPVPDGLELEFPELDQLKRLKGDKVFAGEGAGRFVSELFEAVSREDHGRIAGLMRQDAGKYLVYSTYAIQYISKITTTYGDYLDGTVYLNRFILSRYPQIILYKRGRPYDAGFDRVNSGYVGAIKMALLEEMVHSVQGNLQDINRNAATQVNGINEELANTILSLDAGAVSSLSEYCQLQAVPDDFPFAKRANLFFFLNPDHFLTERIGPDVMTFTQVEIDPKIGEAIPGLLDIYKRWLGPIQQHHAAFAAMEGMAGFAVEGILRDDPDFGHYLDTYMGTDFSSYQVRKSMGRDFTRTVYQEMGRDAFARIIESPPDTREVKDPRSYVARLGR